MPEINKMLTLSTGHVTKATQELLDNTDLENWPVFGGIVSTVGWFMFAHDPYEGLVLPDELVAIFAYAEKHGCNYVLFDCDANVIDELPFYDW